MKILLCASEVAPLAKTGGLADVAGALPLALKALGHDVRVALPLYKMVKAKAAHLATRTNHLAIPLGTRSVEGGVVETRLPGTEIPVYLVDQPEFFDREQLYQVDGRDYPDNLERFTFFARALLEALPGLGLLPDVIHANDWQTALLCAYLSTLYRHTFPQTATVFTIHNLAYQGTFPREQFPLLGLTWDHFVPDRLEYYGKVCLLKAGLVYAQYLTTVSPTYAQEIQTPEFGFGLEGVLQARKQDLVGIVNGIDPEEWNPATNRALAQSYTPQDLSGKVACKAALQREQHLPERADAPLIGMITRLTDQKGLDILAAALPQLLSWDCQLVILGTGDPKYHHLLEQAAQQHPKRLRLRIAFDPALAHRIEAGSDLFLMPSRFEPCGLNQMYSLRYGTVPIVRKTGGLADTIIDATREALVRGTATGFVFEAYTAEALLASVQRALATYRNRAVWRKLMETGMAQDFSWKRSAQAYVTLYERALARLLQPAPSGR
ncbi:MAG: glycogen synthase GlgA [Candidatus Omnitrophica bacterium]|nr:glycogen synthase GlgA [Candidatus Omnitrophota bacterium]